MCRSIAMSETKDAPETRPGVGRWTWIIGSSLFALVVFGLPFLAGQWEQSAEVAPEPDAAPAPEKVRDDFHYYVLLTVVEVAATDDGESSWDSRSGAPDLAYEIHWQGTKVFVSSTKKDSLLAKWSNTAVELTDLLESVSLDDSFKAARITARRGDLLTFRVLDKDFFKDDVVAEWEVAVETLKVGDQEWIEPGGRVVKAICRVLPLDRVDFEELTR
jgi:hypothetical protein